MCSSTLLPIAHIIQHVFGISSRLKGSDYLKEAVALILQSPTLSVMQIYEQIAESHNCKAASIEHTIRYAIEQAYTQNRLNHSFPDLYGKPFNSEVIWQIAEFVKQGFLTH